MTTNAERHRYPPLSPTQTGLRGRCPRCGQGKLFDGFLTTAKKCERCGLDFEFIDSGDGPAVFIIMIVGFLVAAGVFAVEMTFMPPMWVHLILWGPLTLGLSLGFLRPLKGLMIAQQYCRSAGEGRIGE